MRLEFYSCHCFLIPIYDWMRDGNVTLLNKHLKSICRCFGILANRGVPTPILSNSTIPAVYRFLDKISLRYYWCYCCWAEMRYSIYGILICVCGVLSICSFKAQYILLSSFYYSFIHADYFRLVFMKHNLI